MECLGMECNGTGSESTAKWKSSNRMEGNCIRVELKGLAIYSSTFNEQWTHLEPKLLYPKEWSEMERKRHQILKFQYKGSTMTHKAYSFFFFLGIR